jgi:diguanylate cyclase (GGDEF)-like protein
MTTKDEGVSMVWKVARLADVLEHGNRHFWAVVGVASVILLGILDYLTGDEFAFSQFYLLPIILVTWAADIRVGFFLSLISSLTLMSAEILGGQLYSDPIMYVVNTFVRVSFYFIYAYLIENLKISRKKVQWAARTDFVTGVFNRRYFQELLGMEIDRAQRYPHPIAVVYMDMDNFKTMNDLFGHKVGDDVLRCIADELKSQLRKTDVIARLGGDEFALLLPSARLAEAEIVLSKVRHHLLETMRVRNWPVTFSIGVVVCVSPPLSAEQIIDKADETMYQVKNSTKNDVRFTVWDGRRFVED